MSLPHSLAPNACEWKQNHWKESIKMEKNIRDILKCYEYIEISVIFLIFGYYTILLGNQSILI